MRRHTIEVSEEAGVRYLHFGSDWIQGAMRVARPWSLELEYTREMMAALLLRPVQEYPDGPRKVLLVGLGAASLVKFLYRHRPNCRMTVVEINPEVVATAYQSFKLPDDASRLRIDVDDGAAWMDRESGRYDLILVDGFDAKARPGPLDTVEFYTNCRRRLAPDGLFVVNLLGHNRGFTNSLGRISQAFEGRSLVFPSCDSGNAICFAATGQAVAAPVEELKLAAQTLKTSTGLNLLPTIARLAQWSKLSEGQVRL